MDSRSELSNRLLSARSLRGLLLRIWSSFFNLVRRRFGAFRGASVRSCVYRGRLDFRVQLEPDIGSFRFVLRHGLFRRYCGNGVSLNIHDQKHNSFGAIFVPGWKDSCEFVLYIFSPQRRGGRANSWRHPFRHVHGKHCVYSPGISRLLEHQFGVDLGARQDFSVQQRLPHNLESHCGQRNVAAARACRDYRSNFHRHCRSCQRQRGVCRSPHRSKGHCMQCEEFDSEF